MLDDAHITEIGETVCDYADEPDQLDRTLVVVNEFYRSRHNVLERCLAEIYLEIGY